MTRSPLFHGEADTIKGFCHSNPEVAGSAPDAGLQYGVFTALFLIALFLVSSVESTFAATSCLSIRDSQGRVLTSSADNPYVVNGQSVLLNLKAACSIPKKPNNNPKPKAVIEVEQDGVTVEKIKVEYSIIPDASCRNCFSRSSENWFRIDGFAFEHGEYLTQSFLKPVLFSVRGDFKIIFSINKSYVGETANVLDEIVFFIKKAVDSQKAVDSRDDDATGVTLAAPAGDVAEASGRKVLTVTLDRALAAGETLAVPLVLGGTASRGSDYTLAAPSPRPQGVAYAHLTSSKPAQRPTLTFTGPSAAAATVILTTTADATNEGQRETVTVTLGTLTATGLNGGAAGSGTVAFAILEPLPEIAITAKTASITEGTGATFTLTANPAPTAPLAVSVTVSQSGDYAATGTTGAQTVTIPASGTAQHTVATVNDAADETHGSVTVTLNSGSGYTVAGAQGAATVSVSDNDDPPPPSVDTAAIEQEIQRMIVRHRDVTGNAGALANWKKVLKTIRGEPGGFTIAELEARVASLGGVPKQRWQRVLDAVKTMQAGIKTQTETDPETKTTTDTGNEVSPVITVTGGGAVAEGTAASFTLTAAPAPKATLAITLTIGQTGSYVGAGAIGTRTVTILAGKTKASFTVATQGDKADEPAGAVTATVEAGTGYTVGTAATASVPVRDDDATGVTLAAPAGDVAESNGRKTLTVQLERALVQGETLAVPLVLGGTASRGSDYTLAAPNPRPQGVAYAHLTSSQPAQRPTLTFTGPSAAAATLRLTTIADAITEGQRETVTVTLGTLTATGLSGGAAGSGTVAFAILEPLPEIAITAKTASITEGTGATFTVTTNRVPGADLTVNLTVSEAAGSDMVAADDEGAATVTIPKGKTEAAFTVATVNDNRDEPNGTVTATLTADGSKDTRYTVAAAPKDAASVSVADDDAASAVTLSIEDAQVREGDMITFQVELSAPAPHEVRVRWNTFAGTAKFGYDFEFGSGMLRFRPGVLRQTIDIFTIDDLIDEAPETFEVELRNAQGATIADGVAVGTIVNSDPMPQAWLGRFGRTVAQQALDGIAGRLTAPRTPGLHGTVAGQALTAVSGAADAPLLGPSGPLTLSARALGLDPMLAPAASPLTEAGPGRTLRDLLLGSHFSLTGAPNAYGGSVALWGRGAQATFDGQDDTVNLDGEVTTGMLGADYTHGHWLVGLALTQSTGTGAYADPRDTPEQSSRRRASGSIESTLTSVLPYAAVQVADRLRLWGTAGYGAGSVTVTSTAGAADATPSPDSSQVMQADTAWQMAAAGGQGTLFAPTEGSGPMVAVTSDALWTRTTSEKTASLADSDADVTRLRLGLTGRWAVAMDHGGTLTPKLEVGGRHDGGDAETGFGVELGGGLAWTEPKLGLNLDVTGRTLLTHQADGFQDQGFAAALLFDPDPISTRGPSLALRQEWGGSATDGLAALFAPTPLLAQGPAGALSSRWTAEAAYGLPAFDDRFTSSPHVNLGLAAGTREYALGWRLVAASAQSDGPTRAIGSGTALAFDLTASRRETDGTQPDHGFRLELSARW